MCRDLNDPNHRRCPSSRGEQRRSRDRAKYAANRAASLTTPVDTAKTEAPEEALIPVSLEDAAQQVRERIHNTFHVGHGKNLGHSTMADDYKERLAASDDIDSWSELEQDVRAVGQSVENRAAQIAGFTAEDAAERHAARAQMVKDRIEPLNAKIDATKDELTEALREINRLDMEDPSGDHSELEDRIAELKARRDELGMEATAEALAIAKECGFGDVGPSGANSALSKIQQGFDPMTLADTKALADARLAALREVRDMGGTIELNDNSSKRVAGIMSEVAEHYPADWIRLSNEVGNLKVKDTKGRAHYSQSRPQKVRKVMTEHSYGLVGEPPEGDGWIMAERTSDGYGWVDPIQYPEKAEKERAEREQEEKDGYLPPLGANDRVMWVRPAIKTRRASGWYKGVSVEGPPPRGWQEGFVDVDGQKVRIFQQPMYRMTQGEWVSELTVDRDRPSSQWQETAGLGTALHEFAHRTEHVNPAIKELEEAFLQRRTTTDGVRDKLENLYNSSRERGRPDSFANKYMGKEYSDGYREVLSTGMEGVFAGAFGSLSGINGQTADADMRAFVLGVLATA